jgi:hypothetical protein
MDTDTFAGQEMTEQEITKQSADAMPAGTFINISVISKSGLEELFYQQELSKKIKNRINGKSYGKNCGVPYSELRYIRVLHVDFEGFTRIGEMIVNQSISVDIIEIFKKLYEISYPIERMFLVDEYNADDNASMEANNSSAFNFRFIDGTARRSLHSYGIAIDINPLYNPYVREINGVMAVLPKSAAEYVDRTRKCAYYIKKDDACCRIFTEHEFTWGGEWKNSKDYQHFEKNTADYTI